MRLEGKIVLALPLPLRVLLPQLVDSPVCAQPVAAQAAVLFVRAVQAQRQAKGVAVAHVDQPGHVRPGVGRTAHPQGQVVEGRAAAAVGVKIAGREQANRETQFPQQPGKQAVQLVAETAAPAGDDFLKQAGQVQPDRPAEVNIQVLEGDAQQVRQLQPAQVVRCRREGRSQMNSPQVFRYHGRRGV